MPKIPAFSIFSLLAIALLLSSCTKKEEGPDLAAAYAAKEYYDSLFISHNIEYFVDGHYQPDSIPPQYRDRLIDITRQYLSEMTALNGPIDSITIISCRPDIDLSCIQATLQLHFHNGQKEAILSPMQNQDGTWLMR